MGNCLKGISTSTFITDKYLFEPLKSDEEECFLDSQDNKSQCNCLQLENTIHDLNSKIIEMDKKINILEQNTRENFKSISDDIYYINEKQNLNQFSNDSEQLYHEPEVYDDQHASFIDEN